MARKRLKKASKVAKKKIKKVAKEKGRYSAAVRERVAKEVNLLKQGKLTSKKKGGKKITSKKQAIRKGISIAESKGK